MTALIRLVIGAIFTSVLFKDGNSSLEFGVWLFTESLRSLNLYEKKETEQIAIENQIFCKRSVTSQGEI